MCGMPSQKSYNMFRTEKLYKNIIKRTKYGTYIFVRNVAYGLRSVLLQ